MSDVDSIEVRPFDDGTVNVQCRDNEVGILWASLTPDEARTLASDLEDAAYQAENK